MQLLDSRRLTGPNLLWDEAGAVIEVELAPAEAEAAIAAWREHASRMLAAVGWGGEQLTWRRHAAGASLALSAPIDALYAATELNEWAWEAAAASITGAPAPDLEAGAARLGAAIARERDPALLALSHAAQAHQVSFLAGEECVTVGLGCGSLSWPASELPDPADVAWQAVRDVPVALVTGTNGKTTTVRMLAAMLEAAGTRAGSTSTDRVMVGGEVLARGDYSGPEGARMLLRDRRVEVAVLETARGGLLRRGLPLRSAAAAAVTNVAADHLGELGIDGVDELAEAKLVVTRIIRHAGRAVLNADDPRLAARGTRGRSPVTWSSLEAWRELAGAGTPRSPAGQLLSRHLQQGGDACLLAGSELVLARGGRRQAVAAVDDVPAAFGGAARYNLANALAALGLAAALGVPEAAMRDGLRALGRRPEDNPGRGRLIAVGGRLALVDYAHNPHGLAALGELVASLPAARRLIMLGQAGDRDDEALRDLARTAWSLKPDRVILKELPELLRGRQPGEVPAILEDELRRLGAPAESLSHAATELDAVRQALSWGRRGDLLLLLTHTQREDVLALLESVGGA